MKNTGLIVCFLCLIKTLCSGQEKLYQAALPPIPGTGFYQVDLRPEIISYCQPDLADLRLLDKNNREIPYLLRQNAPEKQSRYFREYPVISKNMVPRSSTTLILQNPDRSKINNLALLIKNTGVTKKASLSGSPDGRNWYALQADITLQSVANAEETSEVKVLQFPLSDYEFYKLDINDSASAPLNILAAGYYDFSAEQGQYEPVPGITVKRTDSLALKQTFLWFTAARPVLVHKLEFKIDSATFFRRNATVFVQRTSETRRHQKVISWEPVKQFQLRSDHENTVQLPALYGSKFYVAIENADNPPLDISTIKALQLKTVLMASLNKNEDYHLVFGDQQALPPDYELAYFEDKIPDSLQVLIPESVTRNAIASSLKSDSNSFLKSKELIWAALLLVIGFLGYMTYKMLQEDPPVS